MSNFTLEILFKEYQKNLKNWKKKKNIIFISDITFKILEENLFFENRKLFYQFFPKKIK